MNLKDYQENAVAELLRHAANLLGESGDKRMVFHSPTGSGKTVMVAEFLARLADMDNMPPFACIWLAPGKLHNQSTEKLEKYYEDSRALECRYFNDLQDKQIQDREILFLNWESINRRKKTNIFVRENERDFYLSKVLENTREAGRIVILVVDESHRGAKTEISQDLVADIAPKIALEVSATPEFQNPDALVRVSLEEVKREGIIKKSVILNERLGETLENDGKFRLAENPDKIILEKALAKRAELAAAFRRAGANVNPLVCVQLPNNHNGGEDSVKNELIDILRNAGVTVQNRKLAIHLSKDKENLENISRNDNETEVIFFKQAIALGWDCPRAHILVLFREWGSIEFSVQTLGRIMRMPEPETGHYADEILNNGYVYTNLPEVELHQDVSGGYVRIYAAHRMDDYAPIKLPSVHRLRQREQTRLSPRFVALFLQEAQQYNLQAKIKADERSISAQFISDYKMDNIDAAHSRTIRGDIVAQVDDEEYLQKLFDRFVLANLHPYHLDNRSVGRIKEAIYEFFNSPLIDNAGRMLDIARTVLSENNYQHFQNALNGAKQKYREETEQRKVPLQPTPEWEVPESVDYSNRYTEFAAQKSVMRPFYVLKNGWKTETAFVKILEESPNVRWWFKNGEDESKYFAVPYKENGEEKPFYVDFIVQFTDDKIGLYDTKSGITVNIAGDKSDGLLSYIKTQNAAGKNLRGGIVAPVNPNNYGQGWKLYTGKGANIRNSDSAEWKPLEL